MSGAGSAECIGTDMGTDIGVEYYDKSLPHERAVAEIQNYALIDAIDPNCRYHVGKAKLIDKGGEESIIRIPYGGTSLDHLNLYKISISKFLRGMENIFYGVYDMNSRGFYHLDIKTSNIVFLDYTLKLIDFGLSGRARRDNVFRNVYVYWPYEMRLLKKDPVTDVSNFPLHIYMMDHYVSKVIPKSRRHAIAENYKKLKEDPNVAETIYRTIDIYSLGITFHTLMKPLTNSGLCEALKDDLWKLIGAMTDPDAYNRIDAAEALVLYRQLLRRHKL